MQTVRFLGGIYPKSIKISANIPPLDWVWNERGLTLGFRTQITESEVTVECDLEIYAADMIHELYKRAFDLTRAAVNLVCFASGVGAIVVFETLIAPDGAITKLHPIDEALPPLVKSFDFGDPHSRKYDTLVRLLVSEPALSSNLTDLIEAISVPNVSSVNCGRAIDGLRRLIAPDLKGGPAWARMRKALNLSTAYMNVISETSTGPRHGDRTHIPGDVATTVLRRTWAVMDRYLAYRLAGRDLTAPEYPELV